MTKLFFILFLFLAVNICYSQPYKDTNTVIGKFYRGLKADLFNLSQQKDKYKTKTAIDLEYYNIVNRMEYNQNIILFLETLYKEEEK